MKKTSIYGALFFSLFLMGTFPLLAASESSIVRSVEKAPEVKSSSELPQLVKHLIKGLKKDEEKAYALLAWIVKDIDYDEYKMDRLEEKASSRYSRKEVPESGDILKTRLGVCADIANLYKQMLEEAQMKAVIIDGCVDGPVDKKKGGCKDKRPGHTWNAVWIEDRWELVDPTWAITGKQTSAMEDVSNKRRYEKELKKREKKSAHTYETREGRSVDKTWFMTPPSAMAQDHQPNDEKWLLTKTRDRKNKNL